MEKRFTPLRRFKADQLSVQVYSNRLQMGQAASLDVIARMKELLKIKEKIRMIFASAPSQSEFLEALKKADVDWKRVTAFHMDEYINLSQATPQSFGQFLRDHLFDAVKPGEVHFIDGLKDPIEEGRRYSKLLQKAPIDIICLGIGENGHLAFNDPPVANFQDPNIVKIVELDPLSRQQQVNDGCFERLSDVPTHALTLTIPTLMSGHHLYCIVPGPTKKNAVQKALNDSISSTVPATILRNHPGCVLYLDQAAYGEDV
ncbi:glucosamine-6-phosphate deaminase [Lederbergia sp. NSJ-179]|uniref:glucosamine-6-phosphate deaminase n=1 Tax=Lederbergia sp. NSJ-179 TaxID=2931402 RepID=UPI001FD4C85C|nr:glucosamine-6-phosphate deaminase [Lederbergia sp. NSJ-179]MCJ7841230.1 glucosamine-6-phosphate deaminase [Lederbergia sp. NSJ-179]